MNIIIKTKNLEITDLLEDFINKKMGALKKFLDFLNSDSLELFVEVEKETSHHRKGDIFMAEANIHLPGKTLMAKAHGEDLMKLVGEVKDELEREIRKYKTKRIEAPMRKYQKQIQENPEM